jgi:hypothetical protein
MKYPNDRSKLSSSTIKILAFGRKHLAKARTIISN